MPTIQELQQLNPDHVKARLEEIVKLFSSKELTKTVQIALIETLGKPCNKWSFYNQVLMVSQGTTDARGYQQWLKVGRHVIKGRRSIKILAPNFVKVKDKDEAGNEIEEPRLIGFRGISVFRYEDTEGKELEKYKPKEIPPLTKVAEKIGVPIEYDSIEGSYGIFMHSKNPDDPSYNKIVLATESPEVFFHELTHAVQHHLFKDLKGGQDPLNETIAELGSCVLASLYGHDITNNAWSYIASYTKEKTPEAVSKMCIKVLEKTFKILSFIIETEKEATKTEDIPN